MLEAAQAGFGWSTGHAQEASQVIGARSGFDPAKVACYTVTAVANAARRRSAATGIKVDRGVKPPVPRRQ